MKLHILKLGLCALAAAAPSPACAPGAPLAVRKRGLRCCPEAGRPYTVHIRQARGQHAGLHLWDMLEPARETLRKGLESRARECGYRVVVNPRSGRPRSNLGAIKDGDVIIGIGDGTTIFAKDRRGPFYELAVSFASRPVALVAYATEPHAHPRNRISDLVGSPGPQVFGEAWSYAFAHRADDPRVKIVPPGFVERFPAPSTRAGPVRRYVWLGGELKVCSDLLPAPVRANMSRTYGVRSADDWQRLMARAHRTVFLNMHRFHCGLPPHRPSRTLPMEYFRIAPILSAGGVVVSEPAHLADEARLRDIVLFEEDYYATGRRGLKDEYNASGWRAATTRLLADGDALAAWRDRAVRRWRAEFRPEALLRAADAWNERS